MEIRGTGANQLDELFALGASAGDYNAAEAVAEGIRSRGGVASGRAFDITEEQSFKGLIDGAVSEYGRLDGLFTDAADLSAHTFGSDTNVTDVPLDVWERTLQVSLIAYMCGTPRHRFWGSERGYRADLHHHHDAGNAIVRILRSEFRLRHRAGRSRRYDPDDAPLHRTSRCKRQANFLGFQ
jgi:NAD(P)-dependent dehydrogenase (short-subunit alcohol dehydrogenase family)